MASQPVTHNPLTAVTLMMPLGCSSSEICRRHSICFSLNNDALQQWTDSGGAFICYCTGAQFEPLSGRGYADVRSSWYWRSLWKNLLWRLLAVLHNRLLLHLANVTSGHVAEVLADGLRSWCKKVKHKYCKTKKCNLLLVLYGCETWFRTLREECRITVYWETYLGLRARKWHETGEKCTVRSFTTCTIHERLEMGRAGGTNRKKRNIYIYVGLT